MYGCMIDIHRYYPQQYGLSKHAPGAVQGLSPQCCTLYCPDNNAAIAMYADVMRVRRVLYLVLPMSVSVAFFCCSSCPFICAAFS